MAQGYLDHLSRSTLFSVIRNGLDLEAESVSLSPELCSTLISFASRQSIQPILYRGLKKANLPEDVIRECDNARIKDLYQFIQQNEALNSVSSSLDQCRLPYVLLKGAVLRDLYPAPELRTSCDLDILIRERDLDRAVRVLESQTAFKMQKRLYHDISMVSPKVHLELHFNIKEDMESIDRLLCRAWDYAGPADTGSRWTFTPEFQVFHVIAHMSYHFLHGGLGVRPFLDLWLLRHRTQFDETEVRQMCELCGILTFYDECCRLSEVWLGKGEYTETTKMLEDFCLSGGVFGSARFKIAGQQRKKRGWKYILSRLFPPLSEIKEIYRDQSGKNHSFIYYHAKRLSTWFGKRKRAELKKRLAGILSSDPDYLDSADELFRRLKL